MKKVRTKTKRPHEGTVRASNKLSKERVAAEAKAFQSAQRSMIERLKAAHARARESGYARIEYDREVGRLVLENKQSIIPHQKLTASEWYPIHLGFGINYANRCAAVETRWDEYLIAQQWYEAGDFDREDIWPVKGSGCDHVMAVMTACKKYNDGRRPHGSEERVKRPSIKQQLAELKARAEKAEKEVAAHEEAILREQEAEAEARAKVEEDMRKAKAEREKRGYGRSTETRIASRMPEKDARLLGKLLETACHETSADAERLMALSTIKALIVRNGLSIPDLATAIVQGVFAPEQEPVPEPYEPTVWPAYQSKSKPDARHQAALAAMSAAMAGQPYDERAILGITSDKVTRTTEIKKAYDKAVVDFHWKGKRLTIAKHAMARMIEASERQTEDWLDAA